MFLNPAGGLSYHLKALLYSGKRWKPFREAVSVWLRQWNPPEKKLIIIGASGGYILDPDFLRRFESIIAVDPDPVAEWIFRGRFASCRALLQWDSRDFFIKPGCTADLFRGFLSDSGSAAVLFSNFLGQIPFLIRSEKKREEILSFWQKSLLSVLDGRSWASFHDRYSCRRQPLGKDHVTSPEKLSGDALIRKYYGADASGEWVDHQTEGLFTGQNRYDYFVWQLTVNSFHITEGVFYTEKEKRCPHCP